MAEKHPEHELMAKLRESGEAAAHIAGRLRRVLDDPNLSVEAADHLLLAINTRSAEIDDIRYAIDQSSCNELTRKVAHQVQILWQDMAVMAAEKTRTKPR